MARPSFKLEWEANAYEHKERSGDWFWAMGIIAVSLAVTSVIFGNIILGILILVGAFSLSLYINRPPHYVRVRVDEKGITRDNIHYPYSTLKSFWIDTEHSHPKIILRSEKMFMPLIVVPLSDEADIDDLHDILSKVIAEEFHQLPYIERVLEYFGF